MNTQPKQKISVQTLTQLAILVAIEVVMKLIGLGSVPVGPLYMSFLTVPIAIGAIVIGPMASMLLGGIFGFVSFMDAIKPIYDDYDLALMFKQSQDVKYLIYVLLQRPNMTLFEQTKEIIKEYSLEK